MSNPTEAEKAAAEKAEKAAKAAAEKAEKAAAEKVAAKKAEEAKAEKAAQELVAASKRGYFIEDGKSVTSRKGIKGEKERVVARDFGEGDVGTKILKDLCEKGLVRKVS